MSFFIETMNLNIGLRNNFPITNYYMYVIKMNNRLNKEIPEASTCEEHNISLIDGIGKKIRSSSELTGFKPI